MGSDKDGIENIRFPQTEVVLSNLRDEAVQALSTGKSFSINSTAKQDGSTLTVSSKKADGSSDGLMIVEGSNSGYGTGINEHLNGKFQVAKDKGTGSTVQNDNFSLSLSNWDAVMGRPDKGTESLTITGADGKPVQKYEPAVMSEKTEGGKVVLDPNGQPEQVTTPAGYFDNNSHKQNPYNPNNHRRETDFILHDAALAKRLGISGDAMSLSLTSETVFSQKAASALEIHGVLRTLDGSRVLGIIDQQADLDANGRLVDAQTSSRLPHKPN